MPLLGTAAVAMWWTIEPAHRAEFGDWHAHEHFPERLAIPGFRRGSRWTEINDPGRNFVLYELDGYNVLTSPAYRARLDDPTPWSTKMMPRHTSMIRSQCRIATSHGGGVAGFVSTLRLSPTDGAEAALTVGIRGLLSPLPDRPGLTAAHLLVTENPTVKGPTTEQRIRGGDGTADWIVIISGYDQAVVQAEAEAALGGDRLVRHGAKEAIAIEHFQLALSCAADDLG